MLTSYCSSQGVILIFSSSILVIHESILVFRGWVVIAGKLSVSLILHIAEVTKVCLLVGAESDLLRTLQLKNQTHGLDYKININERK